MVWFYTRADAQLRIETVLDPGTKEYLLKTEWPGRPLVIERFPDAAAFDVRVLALERELHGDGWDLADKEVLPHGWRGPINH